MGAGTRRVLIVVACLGAALTACTSGATTPDDAPPTASGTGSPVAAEATGCDPDDVALETSVDGGMQGMVLVVVASSTTQTCDLDADLTVDARRPDGGSDTRVTGNPLATTLTGRLAPGSPVRRLVLLHEPCGGEALHVVGDVAGFDTVTWEIPLGACGGGPDNAPALSVIETG